MVKFLFYAFLNFLLLLLFCNSSTSVILLLIFLLLFFFLSKIVLLLLVFFVSSMLCALIAGVWQQCEESALRKAYPGKSIPSLILHYFMHHHCSLFLFIYSFFIVVLI